MPEPVSAKQTNSYQAREEVHRQRPRIARAPPRRFWSLAGNNRTTGCAHFHGNGRVIFGREVVCQAQTTAGGAHALPGEDTPLALL
jgi:hypothetical protein